MTTDITWSNDLLTVSIAGGQVRITSDGGTTSDGATGDASSFVSLIQISVGLKVRRPKAYTASSELLRRISDGVQSTCGSVDDAPIAIGTCQ